MTSQPESTTTVMIEGRTVVLAKFISGFAYARSGNAHNPTPRTYWTATVDGTKVALANTRRYVLEVAREYIETGEGR